LIGAQLILSFTPKLEWANICEPHKVPTGRNSSFLLSPGYVKKPAPPKITDICHVVRRLKPLKLKDKYSFA
jgi:hypothetical protein